jgi:hypothetical protein
LSGCSVTDPGAGGSRPQGYRADARLQADTRDGTDASRIRIDQLTTWIERERLVHRTSKNALQATRDERDKLKADLPQAQLELNRRSVSNDTDLEFPSGGANAA